MSRSCEKEVLRRGLWTDEEDQKLIAYVQQHGHGSWSALPEKAGLKRCGKSCRLRWINYLRPGIKRGKFSLQEEQTIIQLHAFLGNKWSAIAALLPKRTDNEIKNHWNTYLKKRLIKMGINPTTHKPRTDALGSSSGCHGSNDANLIHMAQWERVRLEAEARSARDSNNKQTLLPNYVQPKTQLLSTTSSVPLPLASRPKCLDILKAWQGMVTDVFHYFPSHDNLESPSSMSSSFSNTQSQVPMGGINQNEINEGVEAQRCVEMDHLYTCNELGDLGNWERVDKFDHLNQELDSLIDEYSTPMAMQGTSTMYSIENAWLADSTCREGNDNNELFANSMRGYSSETFITGMPVSFSSMEVQISSGIVSCKSGNMADHNGSYDWDSRPKGINAYSSGFH